MRVLKTLEELDALLSDVREEPAGRVANFCMEHAVESADPHSEEYRLAVIARHHELTAGTMNAHRRITAADAELIALAVERVSLPPGSSVLLFGTGSGSMAIALSRAGFLVTVVEPNSADCEALREQLRAGEVAAEVLNESFSYLQRLSEPVDGVVFCNALGGALDHHEIFSALDEAVRSGGKVLFAGEPIFSDFPIPWGLRLNGASLWGARKHGWLELGFRERYLTEALARAGWVACRHERGSLFCWEATRRKSWSYRFPGSSQELHSQLGFKTKSTIRVNSEKRGFALFGPYAQTPPGRWMASLELRGLSGDRPRGLCTMDVCAHGRVYAVRDLHLNALPEGLVALPFELSAKSEVEVRLHANGPVELEIVAVHIYPAV